MLGQVLSNQENEFIKPVEVGNLPAVGGKETANNGHQSEVTQLTNGTPVCCFTTAWVFCKRGGFRINVTVIGPKLEQPQDGGRLLRRKVERMTKEVSDLVEALKKELG